MKGLFFPHSVRDGAFNMNFDAKMLKNTIKTGLPALRFYGWSPACVSLGRNQDFSHINTNYCQKCGINIVRRLTGGRALFHDNELTYSFTCRADFLENGDSVVQSYKEISGALIKGLKKLGISADFPKERPKSPINTKFEYCMSLSTGADLSFEGKKLVGSAQFRKEGAILQHGSILFHYEPEKISQIFGEEPRKDKITVLDEISPGITPGRLCCGLKAGFEEKFGLEFVHSEDLF